MTLAVIIVLCAKFLGLQLWRFRRFGRFHAAFEVIESYMSPAFLCELAELVLARAGVVALMLTETQIAEGYALLYGVFVL